jgi:hypothetical protein
MPKKPSGQILCAKIYPPLQVRTALAVGNLGGYRAVVPKIRNEGGWIQSVNAILWIKFYWLGVTV